jgi:hypothetical protein
LRNKSRKMRLLFCATTCFCRHGLRRLWPRLRLGFGRSECRAVLDRGGLTQAFCQAKMGCRPSCSRSPSASLRGAGAGLKRSSACRIAIQRNSTHSLPASPSILRVSKRDTHGGRRLSALWKFDIHLTQRKNAGRQPTQFGQRPAFPQAAKGFAASSQWSVQRGDWFNAVIGSTRW